MNNELQINAVTKKAYGGINQILLAEAKNMLKFVSDEWLTYKQAQSKGLQVRKGSHGVRVIKMVKVERKHESEVTTTLVPRNYTVFNLCQMEGSVMTETLEDAISWKQRQSLLLQRLGRLSSEKLQLAYAAIR